MRTYDLEERLIDFAAAIFLITDKLPKTDAGHYLGRQIIRSGASPALNYGEAQSAESRKDFIHKMKIALKELRETYINLRLIEKSRMQNRIKNFSGLKDENNELISIFVKSIQTARKKGGE